MPENLMPAYPSSFEIGSGNVNASNATRTRDFSVSYRGASSMKLVVSLAQETTDANMQLSGFSLAPSTAYTWQTHVYLPVDTSLNLLGMFLQENASPFRKLGIAGVGTAPYVAGWHTITGSGTTPADWVGPSRLVVRPARKDDGSAYDSTKEVYYDASMVQTGTVASPWVLGGEDYNAVRITPDAVLASSGFSNATTPNIAFIQDDPEAPDANSFS